MKEPQISLQLPKDPGLVFLDGQVQAGATVAL